MRLKYLFYTILLLSGCALPVSELEDQLFVAEKEIEVVSLVREGLDYFKRGRYTDSQFKFWQASYLAPEADNIKLNLGLAMKQQGIMTASREIFEKLLEKEPRRVQYIAAMAGWYTEQGDYDTAYQMYEKAYYIAAQDWELARMNQLLQSMVVAAFRIGNVELAICNASLAYQQLPAIDQLLTYVKLLISESRRAEAQKVLSDFRSRSKVEDARVLHYQAMALYLEGDFVDLFRLKSLLELSANYEQIKTESQLLYAVVEKQMESMGRLEEIQEYLPEKDPEESDEEEVDLLETLYGGKALDSADRIFWPKELLEKLEEFLPEQEEAGI